jgi:hypothetical protein
MGILTWLSPHRWWWGLGIGVLVCVVAAAAGVWFFVLRSPGTQVSLRQALRLYRAEESSGGTTTDSHLPPEGVYRYRTSGGEHLSLADISRSFPSSSEMIVTDDHCADMKWEPLLQHTEGLVECRRPDGALVVQSTMSYEEIAGAKTTSVIRCPADTYIVPPNWSAGERWRSVCRSNGEKVTFSGEVVGPAWVDVGHWREPALHTRLTLSFSGSESGTNPNDYWIAPNDGVILRQQETVDVAQKAGPLGSVHYTEQMTITLASMAPTS